MHSQLLCCLSLLVALIGRCLLSTEAHSCSSGQEDIHTLQLLQVSHGIVHSAVAPGGRVEEMVSSTTDADLLKPSSLALSESEAEDLNTMHLLQTSRDVSMPMNPKAEDVEEVVTFLQVDVNTSTAETPSLPAVRSDNVAGHSQDLEAGTIILGPEEARSSTVILPAKTGASMLLNSQVNVKDDAMKVNPDLEALGSASALTSVHAETKNRSLQGTLDIMWPAPLDNPVALSGSGVQLSLPALLVLGFFVALLLLVLMGATRLGTWCLDFFRYSEDTTLRKHVEGMYKSPGLEVVNKLIAGGVYDCAIMRPLSSKQLIRLEARVEEAASGICLWTPLTQQACVRFNATVSQQANGTSLLVPMSLQCASIDFVVSLLDAPHVRIEIQGDDLTTFDMTAGQMSAKRNFDSAARHWQEFAMTYQIGGKVQPASRFRSEHSVLEFQETAIVLGTSITVVGELQRNAVGTLLLRPCKEDVSEDPVRLKQEAWRTSWESAGSGLLRKSLTAGSKPWLGKVCISDDPALLDASHKHAKYDPTAELNTKPARDCSMQISQGLVNLISSEGQ